MHRTAAMLVALLTGVFLISQKAQALTLAPAIESLSLHAAVQKAEIPATHIREPARRAIARFIRAALGKPYQYGATDDSAFDCSSLVQRAYEAAGRQVPRVASEQLKASAPVPLSKLRSGDLLFYRMSAARPQRLHVVIYMGEGRAIHASVKHQVVREIDITGRLWASRLVAARRLL